MGVPVRAGGHVRWTIDWPAGVDAGGIRLTIDPAEPGGLASDDMRAEGSRSTALLAGGLSGRRYRVTARAGGRSRTLDVIAGGL